MIPKRPDKVGKSASVDDFIAGAKADANAAPAAEVKQPKQRGRRPSPDKDEWTKMTFIVREEYLEQLSRAAYWDRKLVKVVLDEALEAFFKDKKYDPIPGR